MTAGEALRNAAERPGLMNATVVFFGNTCTSSSLGEGTQTYRLTLQAAANGMSISTSKSGISTTDFLAWLDLRAGLVQLGLLAIRRVAGAPKRKH